MSRYRHLPVWKAALDLAVHLEHAVRRFPRYHKYTLGSELRQTSQRAAGRDGFSTLHFNPERRIMNIRTPLRAALAAWLILLATPALAAFTDNNDGTVTDGVTGLMWDKCSWGQSNIADCSGGAASTHTWVNALNVAITANGTSHRTYNDWRLPNKNELESLVDRSIFNPAIDPAFPNTPSNWYWSSTTYAPDPAVAWSVHFYNGYPYAYGKASGLHVRLLRSGQSFDPIFLC